MGTFHGNFCERGDTHNEQGYSVNTSFYKYLSDYNSKPREEFVENWNAWVDKNYDENSCLDFSKIDFRFQNENLPISAMYSLKHIQSENAWNFADLKLPNVKFDSIIPYLEFNFSSTIFKGNASFNQIIFDDRVDFSLAEFTGGVFFKNTTFRKEVDFTAKEFSNEISLENTLFKDAIYCNEKFILRATLGGALLADLNKMVLPEIDKKKIKKDGSTEYYRFLRRYYVSRLNHDLERKYFALELEREYPLELKNPSGWIRSLYWLISDYGNSIRRPILFILSVYFITATGSTLFNAEMNFFTDIFSRYSDVLLTNMPFGGYKAKILFNGWTNLINEIVTYTGLFLMGLAIRNRFRIK